MELLCHLARTDNFAICARELSVSPAYISKRVAILEKALNTKLFYRTTRSVGLTEDGETILQWSQKILDDISQMKASVVSAHTEPNGLLRITTSNGFGRNRLAPALSALTSRYPSLGVQLELLDRPVDLVGEGFDIDIRIGGAHEPGLLVRPLARNWRILCAAPVYLERAGTPRKPSDLSSHDCIVIRERDQSGPWKLVGPKGTETIKVRARVSSNSGEVVHQWAVDGHGVILRSVWDVMEDVRMGRLVHILPEYRQDADVAAIYAQRLDYSGRLRACIEFLKTWFAQHPLY